jgi:glycosyltransferase involved in cell wall biosynthesis
MAVELGVANRVRFAGWIKDTKPYVAAADVFAMASSHEPLGNVVLEAWAQRVPVVSTRAEGPSWFMTHGRDGLMVDIGDAEGFAVAFQQILADRSLAERLTAGGEQTLLGTFSEQSVVDAYLKLFSAQQDRTTTKAA